MQHFNEETFSQAEKNGVTALIDFYADWCGPCKMLAPVISQLAEQYEGTVKIVKVNVDQSPALAANYGISSIPTLLYFRGGKVCGTSVGMTGREDLERKLNAWGKA